MNEIAPGPDEHAAHFRIGLEQVRDAKMHAHEGRLVKGSLVSQVEVGLEPGGSFTRFPGNARKRK